MRVAIVGCGSAGPAAALLRDGLLPLLGRSRFFDRQMLASMAGLETGLLAIRPESQAVLRAVMRAVAPCRAGASQRRRK